MNIGAKISEVRRSKGVTQTFIARRLNKTPQWLSNIEKGRRLIEAGELNEIAALLGVNVAIFFENELNKTFNITVNSSDAKVV